MSNKWKNALENMPTELKKALVEDGYSSAEDLEECFQDEDKLEKYMNGLLFIRRAIALEGVTEDTLSFSRPMGALRKLLRVAKAEAARVQQECQRKQEIQETEEKERAKVSAKEGAKEAAKHNKRIVPGEKIRLEEQLGRACPGMAGLSGKEHSSVGRKFLQTLIKERQEKTFDIPKWEDR